MVMTSESNLATISGLARQDPMTGEGPLARRRMAHIGRHDMRHAACCKEQRRRHARHAAWVASLRPAHMPACPLGLPALLPAPCLPGPSDSWAPAYVRVAVPFGATLLALLCFGQAVRLAVHVGFNVRVQGLTGGKGLGHGASCGRRAGGRR